MAIIKRRTKQTWEEYDIYVDFAPDLVENEVLAVESTVGAREYPEGADASSFLKGSADVGTTKLTQWITGGTSGKEYWVEFKAVTSGGRKLKAEWLITVCDPVVEVQP